MSEGPPGGQDSRRRKIRRRPGDNPAPHGDAYTWYQRGLELLGRGSAAAAAQLLERAAEAEPESRSVLEALAAPSSTPAGTPTRPQTSGRSWRPARRDDYAQFGLGLALARSGDPGAAAEHLALAAAMRPDLPALHRRAARRPGHAARPVGAATQPQHRGPD